VETLKFHTDALLLTGLGHLHQTRGRRLAGHIAAHHQTDGRLPSDEQQSIDRQQAREHPGGFR
jgi:hypothetical protein